MLNPQVWPMKYKRFLCWIFIPVLASFFLAGCTLVQINLGPKAAPLEEQTIAGSGQPKVLAVTISGLLLEDPPRRGPWPWLTGENQLARLAEELDQARRDPHVKGLLVKINSPGGSVAAADLIYHQIREFRRQTGLKVVAALMGVAASGGYYAALAADRIVALPTTVTGSIGVISLKLNLAGLMDRYGVETETVKSAPMKDMWSPFRPAGEEEKRIMQDLIDELFERFKTTVRENRPGMSAEQLDQAAQAQVMTAGQALGLGLIDQIGYPEDAFEMVKKMAGLAEARLVVYHRPGAYRANIYAETADHPAGLSAPDLPALAGPPRLMYLWLPGLR